MDNEELEEGDEGGEEVEIEDGDKELDDEDDYYEDDDDDDDDESHHGELVRMCVYVCLCACMYVMPIYAAMRSQHVHVYVCVHM